jgi:uncharacterized membrane protein
MAENTRLPDHVQDNIQAISELRTQEERSLPSDQRAIEALTSWLGRPRTLYALASMLLAWVGYNLLAHVLGGWTFDAPPFFMLQGIVGIYAALMTTMILVTQNRQGGYAQRNAHLDLQVNILAEQRTAKIVALLEELRRDIPNVPNRVDPVAEALQHTVHPHDVSFALDEQRATAALFDSEEEQS